MNKKNRLNKKDLARKIAKHGGMKIDDAERFLDSLIEVFRQTMESDEEIILQNMGSFSITERGERLGYNPVSGEQMMFKAKRRVKFVPSGTLRIDPPAGCPELQTDID